jgi:hypothetical protein
LVPLVPPAYLRHDLEAVYDHLVLDTKHGKELRSPRLVWKDYSGVELDVILAAAGRLHTPAARYAFLVVCAAFLRILISQGVYVDTAKQIVYITGVKTGGAVVYVLKDIRSFIQVKLALRGLAVQEDADFLFLFFIRVNSGHLERIVLHAFYPVYPRYALVS